MRSAGAERDGRHRHAPAARRAAGAGKATGVGTGVKPRWRSLQRLDELGHRGEPVRGDWRERLLDRLVDALRHVGPRSPARSATGSVSHFAMIACAVEPVNGGSPASIS